LRLADHAPFRLGLLGVDPALRQVDWPGARVSLQPRAMQVLVVLAAAAGAVVSREQLIESCWDGRAVSGDAVHRIVHLLRELEARSGAFTIRTVPRVGYRLVAAAPRPAPAEGAGPVLAVLAFEADDPDLAYFADGISEEILNTVARTTAVKVIGRASSFALRGKDKAAGRVAALLGASHLLDGTVRRAADKVRITAELVECGGQTRLWSERFDRPLADVFTLQDDIAAAVARSLDLAFAPSPGARPIDPVAFDLYLRARDPARPTPLPDISLLEQVVERAPDFAAAWALLAYARAVRLHWSAEAPGAAVLRATVTDAARRALALDPAAGAAMVALAAVEPVCGAFDVIRGLAEEALAAAPRDIGVLVYAAGFWDTVGRPSRALTFAARANDADPRAAGWYLAYLLEASGRRAEAWELYDRDLGRWPDTAALAASVLRSAFEAGEWERFDTLLARFSPETRTSPVVDLVLAEAARMRRLDAAGARAALAQLAATTARTGLLAFSRAGRLAAAGYAAEVWDIAARADFSSLFAPGGRLPFAELGLNMLFSPTCAVLRRDRRFAGLAVRLGLGAWWSSTGEWPDFAAEVSGHYDLEAETARLLGG
jgi:TolB-like protein